MVLDYDKVKPAITAYSPSVIHQNDAISYSEDALAKKAPYQITGIDINYMSTLPNFNDAKRAEEKDRRAHITAWPRED